jgi:hypothetical protein
MNWRTSKDLPGATDNNNEGNYEACGVPTEAPTESHSDINPKFRVYTSPWDAEVSIWSSYVSVS